jgi:hypothetical protein
MGSTMVWCKVSPETILGVRAVSTNSQVTAAEARGFEPRMGVNPNRISRVVRAVLASGAQDRD